MPRVGEFCKTIEGMTIEHLLTEQKEQLREQKNRRGIGEGGQFRERHQKHLEEPVREEGEENTGEQLQGRDESKEDRLGR